MELSDKILEREELLALREGVLAQWPTGAEVNLEEAMEYQGEISPRKTVDAVMGEADAQGRTLMQPRGSASTVEEQMRWLSAMAVDGGADVLPTTLDPLTRQNRYEEVERERSEQRITGRTSLGGFPVVNLGVEGSRQVTESVDRPIQLRYSGTDPRLLAEIALAGGYTGIEGGGISSNIPHVKNVSLEQSIGNWLYVDRLVGLYQEAGIPINREPYGPLTGTLVPPCVSHSVAILEALMAAKQGVRSITVGYGQCGNLVQDVAALRTLRELTAEYLERFDLGDVRVTTVFHQWMGGFPEDEARACGVIGWGSTAAALAGATKVMVRPTQEVMRIPTLQGITQALRCTKQTISMLADQRLEEGETLRTEMEMISRETRAILERCLQLGGGDVVQAALTAFRAGVLDVPFAPGRICAGRLLPVRDNHGAVRILNPGALPLDKESLRYHQEKIEERCQAERRKASFQMVIDDIYAISAGKLVGRP